MLHLEADYDSGEKTLITSELAFSDNDQNLFSSLDNDNNKGFAAKASWNQGIIDKSCALFILHSSTNGSDAGYFWRFNSKVVDGAALC